MPDLQELPTNKMPIGSNQWLNSLTYILAAIITCVTIYFLTHKETKAEADCGPAFTEIAKGYAKQAAQITVLEADNERLRRDSIQNAAVQWKSNNYLKKKVLNPLKKQYNER